jgi:tRNA(Ile)-lysidine synthase
VVAYFNHRLREEAAKEAKFVEDFALGVGVPFILGEEDVGLYSENRSLSVEEAARELRYRFLFEVAEERNSQAVVVAHNANDQVETVLMHMLRGAGLSGLKGMKTCSHLVQFSETIPLMRPLLNTWRKEILMYCQENDLQPVIDASNLESTYYRNRLRHEFIPFLETYNTNVQTAIWRMSQTLAGDQEVVDEVIQTAWDECFRQQGAGFVALSIPDFLNQLRGIRRGLFRKAISKIRPGLRDIDFLSIERGIEAVDNSTRSQRIDLAAGLCLLTEQDVVWIATWEADLPTFDWPQITGKNLELDNPGITDLGKGWRVEVTQVESSKLERSNAMKNTNPYQAWIDSNQLDHPLSIRRRKPGDRFQPLGMDGKSKKLADFYINVKIPRRARDAWPLVCTDTTIHWIPGYRQSHQSRITEQSRELLALRMEKVIE